MKDIVKVTICGMLALSAVSCSQTALTRGHHGDRGLTNNISVDRNDCKLILGRAVGEDRGFKLLGVIPLKSPSESVAVDRMYADARARGAQPEGEARQFVNTSIEHTANYFILFSVPTVRSSGDLVQFYGKGANTPGITNKRRADEEDAVKESGSVLGAAAKKLYGIN